MAGRRAHIGNDRFTEFFETIPEESRSQGYWRIKRESISESGVGGVVQAMLGFIPFNSQESYESLKGRIKDSFAVNKGPGTYYAIPCDDRKRELKDVDMVKVEFTDKEVPVPNPAGQSNGDSGTSSGDPFKDTVNTVKKVHKDMAELRAMKVQEKLMKNLLGEDDEEDDVKEAPGDMMGGMQNMLLYRQLFQDDSKKKDSGNDEIKDLLKEFIRSQQPKGDPETKELLKELVRAQAQQHHQPKEDPTMKAVLEELKNQKQAEKQESTLQTIFAMQLKQQEERDKIRHEEMRAREEERKEERRKAEEQARLDRERFQAEIKEREERFRAEMEIRRQEMRSNEATGKHAMTDQQAMQMKLFEVLSSNKNSGMDALKTMAEMMTGAGLSSMKTAQSAADAILSIAAKTAKDDDRDEEKGGNGVMEILKNLAPLAGSLLGPYANANAQQQMMQAMAGMGPGGMEALLAGLGGMGGMPGPRPQAPKQRPQQPQQPQQQRPPVSPVTEAPVAAQSAQPKASDKMDNGGMAMIIAKVLKDNPEIKHMMIGNMSDKLGVELFVDFLYDFDIPGVDKMIAMMPPQVLMQFVKTSCTPDEIKVIDANLQWFTDLKRIVLEEIKAEKEEEEAEDAEEKVVKDVAAGAAPVAPAPAAPAVAPVPAPAPQALTPAPAPAAQA